MSVEETPRLQILADLESIAGCSRTTIRKNKKKLNEYEREIYNLQRQVTFLKKAVTILKDEKVDLIQQSINVSNGSQPEVTQKEKKLPQKSMKETHQIHLRYVHEFIADLRASPWLLEMKLFPDAKELTESMAAFNAAREHLIDRGFNFKDTKTGLLAIGDGSTPRIACLYAVRTNWTCFSVDPQMKLTGGWSEVQRLFTANKKIQEFCIEGCLGNEKSNEIEKLVVVMMHCHVDFPDIISSFGNGWKKLQLGVIACSCCNWVEKHASFLGHSPIVEYEDVSMASEKRFFRIWNFSHEEIVSFTDTKKQTNEILET